MLVPFFVVFLAQAGFHSALAGQSTAQQPPAATEQPNKPWPPPGVSRPGGGVTSPEVLKETKPAYTDDAKAANIQGIVEVEAVVQADGTIGDVRVVRSLDRELGLDEEAIKAVKKWRFAPGKKQGVAVPVLVAIEMTFALRK